MRALFVIYIAVLFLSSCGGGENHTSSRQPLSTSESTSFDEKLLSEHPMPMVCVAEWREESLVVEGDIVRNELLLQIITKRGEGRSSQITYADDAPGSFYTIVEKDSFHIHDWNGSMEIHVDLRKPENFYFDGLNYSRFLARFSVMRDRTMLKKNGFCYLTDRFMQDFF